MNNKTPNILPMKTLIISLLVTLISSFSFSQDIIYKRDGSKIEAKVIEITTTTIKYKNFAQPDGPIRNVEIYEVRDIVYENGEWDKFEEKAAVVPERSTNPERTTPLTVRVSKPAKDCILGSGFFIDGMVGYSNTTRTQNSSYDPYSGNYTSSYSYDVDEMTVQMRLGFKWYLGPKEKNWRSGIQLTILRLAIYHDLYQPTNYSLSPANLGVANIFKINENNALEINADFGFNMMNFEPPPFGDFGGGVGIIYGAEMKYRFKTLAIGLNFSRINTFSSSNKTVYNPRNLVSLSIGRKF